MNIEISIIIPSIRKDNLIKIYESIRKSTKRPFEIIFISPNDLPNDLLGIPNVKLIKDFGSPIRASQIGLLSTNGKLVMLSADDAFFFPEALDKNISDLYEKGENYKNVMTAKYLEGPNGKEKKHQSDEYYQINNTEWTRSSLAKDDWLIFNACIMYREFLIEMGGWDCNYNTTLSQADLAIRSYREGAQVFLSKNIIFDCDHSQADHGPVEHSFINHDFPLYKAKFQSLTREFKNKIDLDNWKSSPAIWKDRFRIVDTK